MVREKGSYSSNAKRGLWLCLIAFFMSANNCPPPNEPLTSFLFKEIRVVPTDWCAGDSFEVTWSTTPEERPVRVLVASGPSPSWEDYNEVTTFDAGSSPDSFDYSDLTELEGFQSDSTQVIHVRFEIIPPAGNTVGAIETDTLHRISEDKDYVRQLNYLESDAPTHTYVYSFPDSMSSQALIKKITLNSVRSVQCVEDRQAGEDGELGTEDDIIGDFNFSWVVENGGEVSEELNADNTWNTGTRLGDDVATGTSAWSFVLKEGPDRETCLGTDWIADTVDEQYQYQVNFQLSCPQ